jgi:hypothetical protein
MGFQGEERDYWHASDTYHQISPFSHALKLAEHQAPLLLVHGDNDNNAGASSHPPTYLEVAHETSRCCLSERERERERERDLTGGGAVAPRRYSPDAV